MIHFSKAAMSEIRRLHQKQEQSNARLRLKVMAGGCMEFYYVLEFDEIVNLGDRLVDCGAIQSIIDSESWVHLDGLIVDYSEDLMGGGFRFQNPNINQSCGCGNSFSVRSEQTVEFSNSHPDQRPV